MNRQQKEKIVEFLRGCFIDNEASILVSYKGLTVMQMQGLRAKLREKKAKLQVSKWRLMRLAVKDIPRIEDMGSRFCGQVGLVFAAKDSASIVKILYDYSKSNNALRVLYGYLYDKVMDEPDIHAVATLPSREVLISRLIGAMNAPIFGVVSVLSNTMRGLVIVLNQIVDKGK